MRDTQGLLNEQTGWLKHGLRWHDTTTSNWSAQDAFSQVLQPDAASRYSYVEGNPPNNVHPTGKGCDWSNIGWYGFSSALLVGLDEAAEVASAAAGIFAASFLGAAAGVGLVVGIIASC
ncbi:hypothetical protein E0H73_16865 [Kribbella pittospori]|uniref:RHS repeat-associated core domain-containing protein n=1 Tax=Kribbella pittospori TaxID=722689 RepID=A0A4R0KPQ1_9ACTN|nr:hypothetical protein [Kribbella pittospori]TCC60936.1 hypothetical protein E0H73_16865 [Kribbella pittospori]